MNRQNTMQSQFKAAYDAYADAIFRFCLLRVSDREQALDITQDTFTRLWLSLSAGKEMTHERSFLYTIAHNLIIDWYRKKKGVSLESLANPETGEPYEPPNENALADIEIETEGRFLIEAIRKLGPSYSQAVYLRFVEGLSPPEIAEILGTTTNATSVRINRGIEELRKITGYNI